MAGSVSFNGADTVATFTPSSSLAGSTTYTATVSGAQNASGTPMSSPFSWSFTTGAVAHVPVQYLAGRDADRRVRGQRYQRADLGLQFQAASSGYITGVRFYKEADDTGTHIGSLWSSTGTLLASRDVQQRDRVGVAGAGLLLPGGGDRGDDVCGVVFHQYRVSRGVPTQGLASAVTNGPLTALAGGGVYAYGSSNTFPTSTYNDINYWVDVVYSHVVGCHGAGGADGGVGDGG